MANVHAQFFYMIQAKTAKWYDKQGLLILFLFLFPPIAIYGAWKSDRKKISKVAFTLWSILLWPLLFIFTVSLADPVTSSPNKENKAAKSADIQEKSINNAQGFSSSEIELLKTFQKKWADSVVKVMNTGDGGFSLKGSKLVSPDSILLEYSEGVTKNGFAVNLKTDTVIYRQWYVEAVRTSLGEKYLKYPVYITCIPNHKINFAEVQAKEQALIDRKNKIARQFSVWDGSHRNLEHYIKQNMNDPESYEHIKTVYEDKGKFLLVETKFRGKNAFGAKIIETVTARVDLEGNVILIIE